MPELDTMHLRNKRLVGILLFSLLVPAVVSGSQAQSSQPQSPSGTQPVQATPLPPDVDPNDPALPVWAKPATPAPSAAKPAPTANVPSTPGKAPDQTISEGSVGEVTKNASGGFTYISKVNEVTLSATVLDLKHHLVTNL